MKIMNYNKLRMLLPVLAVITAVFLLSPSVAYAAGNGEAVSPSDAVFDDMEYSETEVSEEDEEVSEEDEEVSEEDEEVYSEEDEIVSDSDASAVIPGEVKWLPNSYKGFPVIPEKAAESLDVIASPTTGEEGEPWVCLALMNLSALAACAVRFGKGAESLKKLGKALKGQ